MRGIYTAGVLDVFLEHGIAFDGVLGVSAGAIHGCSYVSGQGGRSIRYYQKYCQDKRFMSFSNLLRRGEMVDTQFRRSWIPMTLRHSRRRRPGFTPDAAILRPEGRNISGSRT